MNATVPPVLAWLQLVRAPNGLTALTNIIAAVCVAQVLQPYAPIAVFDVLLLCLSSLSLYYAGMALNDYWDFDEDLRERPTRPLPSGALSRNHVATAIASLLSFGFACAYLVSAQSALIALALALNIVAYDTLIKKGVAGAFCMGGCRYVNWLLGLSILPMSSESLLLPLPILFYIAALTWLSKQETHARDRNSLVLVALLLFLSMLSLFAVLAHLDWPVPGTLAVFVLAALVTTKLLQTARNFEPHTVQSTVTWMIIGIIPYDALMLFIAGAWWPALGVFLLFFPCRWLSKRLYMT